MLVKKLLGKSSVKITKNYKILVLLTNVSLMGFSGQMFGLISSFLSNRQLQVVLDGKASIHNIQLMPKFLKAPFLVV